MKNEQSTLGIIRKLIEGHNVYMIFLFIVMLLAAGSEAFGLSLILPVLYGLVNQEAKFEKVFEYLDIILWTIPAEYKMLGLLAIMVIAFILKNALLVAHNGMSAHFSMRLREQWSTRILSTYLRYPYLKVMDLKHGVMVHNTAFEPFQTMKAIVSLLDLVCKAVMAAVIFVMLMVVKWKATLITAGLAGLIWLCIKTTTYRYSVKVGKQRLHINQEGSRIATESLGAIKEIKMLGEEGRHVGELMKRMKRDTSIYTRFNIYNNLPDNLIEPMGIFLISLVMGYFIVFSRGNLGDLLPYLVLFIVVGQKLFKYLSYIISQRMKVLSRLPSLQMIYDWVTGSEDQEDVKKGKRFTKLETDILFRDVGFSYDNSEPVFYYFSIRIPKNKMTVIVGSSGSGKSTLADLLMRLLNPQSGKIECNQKDIQEFSLKSWRGKIGYVSQHPYLFNMTLRENIRLGKPNAKAEEIVSAAKNANIHDFITGLPKGYDTIVGDRGVKLSGGQLQRVVIARTIISDPEIFIFDEATSALDKEAEKIIQESIEKLASKKTTVVIAHRLSTIDKADVVYDMDQLAMNHEAGDLSKNENDMQYIKGMGG